MHPSEPISLEVEQMVKIQKKHKFQIAAAILAACILVGGSGTVYAANVGESSVPSNSGFMATRPMPLLM